MLVCISILSGNSAKIGLQSLNFILMFPLFSIPLRLHVFNLQKYWIRNRQLLAATTFRRALLYTPLDGVSLRAAAQSTKLFPGRRLARKSTIWGPRAKLKSGKWAQGSPFRSELATETPNARDRVGDISITVWLVGSISDWCIVEMSIQNYHKWPSKKPFHFIKTSFCNLSTH